VMICAGCNSNVGFNRLSGDAHVPNRVAGRASISASIASSRRRHRSESHSLAGSAQCQRHDQRRSIDRQPARERCGPASRKRRKASYAFTDSPRFRSHGNRVARLLCPPVV